MLHPSDESLMNVLSKAKTIAIIGAKDKPTQAVDRVGRYLLEAGYIIIPVHPVRRFVWGIPTYASITDIPVPIDIVNLFRAPEFCPLHAQETVSLLNLPKVFWMQKGIQNSKAVAIVQQSGILPVEDLCIMVEHNRLFCQR